MLAYRFRPCSDLISNVAALLPGVLLSARRRVTAVLTAGLAATTLGWRAPANAADQVWPVPPSATITIDGKGFGHGRGLSQYGALGRAQDHQTYREIVRFYYPGTRWGTDSGQVKVLITRDTTRDVVVASRGGLTVRSLGSGNTSTLPAKRDGRAVNRWRITPASGGNSAVAYRTGAWHQWRVLAGDAQFAAGGRPVELFTPAGTVEYRGALRSASTTGLDRDTVNILSLDSYLKGVVPQEVPALWHPEAVKAQAVAARTYAAYERDHAPGSRHYQLCDTAHCQVYGGFSAEHPSSNAAVDATAREVVTWGGEPAFTQFSASNGGYSVAGQFDYLPAQPDPYDHYDPDHDGGDGWRTTVADTEIEDAYFLENLAAISIDSRDATGRVETIELTTSKGWTGTVTGESFRLKLGLRSTLFTISDVQESPPGA